LKTQNMAQWHLSSQTLRELPININVPIKNLNATFFEAGIWVLCVHMLTHL
jgi:hypothetical protein